MVDKMIGKMIGSMEKKGPTKSISVKVKNKDGSKMKLKIKNPPSDKTSSAKKKLVRGMKGYKK